MINFIEVLKLTRHCFYSCIFEMFSLIFNTDAHFLYMSRIAMLHVLCQVVSRVEGMGGHSRLTKPGPIRSVKAQIWE